TAETVPLPIHDVSALADAFERRSRGSAQPRHMSSARTRTVMNERAPPRRFAATVMTSKARLHFQSIAILNELDRAERRATPEQFASAAKITARPGAGGRKSAR